MRGQVVALSAKTGKVKWNTFIVPPGHDGGVGVDHARGRHQDRPRLRRHRQRLPRARGRHDRRDRSRSTRKTGAILGKFQATAGDVWNGTSNAAEGPDYDFGASPQLFTGPNGEQLVGEGQKSGVYRALDRSDAWSRCGRRNVGPGAFVVGGVIGSTATDGKRSTARPPSAASSGRSASTAPTSGSRADGGPLKFNATSVANGVVYTTDMTGFLVGARGHDRGRAQPHPAGRPELGRRVDRGRHDLRGGRHAVERRATSRPTECARATRRPPAPSTTRTTPRRTRTSTSRLRPRPRSAQPRARSSSRPRARRPSASGRSACASTARRRRRRQTSTRGTGTRRRVTRSTRTRPTTPRRAGRP